mgnify:CR=1 FL=1
MRHLTKLRETTDGTDDATTDESGDTSADEDTVPDEDAVVKNPDDLLGEWDFTDTTSHISVLKNDQTGGYMLDINFNN